MHLELGPSNAVLENTKYRRLQVLNKQRHQTNKKCQNFDELKIYTGHEREQAFYSALHMISQGKIAVDKAMPYTLGTLLSGVILMPAFGSSHVRLPCIMYDNNTTRQ